jgi:hypothetical protein
MACFPITARWSVDLLLTLYVYLMHCLERLIKNIRLDETFNLTRIGLYIQRILPNKRHDLMTFLQLKGSSAVKGVKRTIVTPYSLRLKIRGASSAGPPYLSTVWCSDISFYVCHIFRCSCVRPINY